MGLSRYAPLRKVLDSRLGIFRVSGGRLLVLCGMCLMSLAVAAAEGQTNLFDRGMHDGLGEAWFAWVFRTSFTTRVPRNRLLR